MHLNGEKRREERQKEQQNPNKTLIMYIMYKGTMYNVQRQRLWEKGYGERAQKKRYTHVHRFSNSTIFLISPKRGHFKVILVIMHYFAFAL